MASGISVVLPVGAPSELTSGYSRKSVASLSEPPCRDIGKYTAAFWAFEGQESMSEGGGEDIPEAVSGKGKGSSSSLKVSSAEGGEEA